MLHVHGWDIHAVSTGPRAGGITNPFPNLILVPLHLPIPIPILTGAALLTFARIITAGAAMDAETQATI